MSSNAPPKTLAASRVKSSDYYDSVRAEIFPLVDPRGKRILDVGCGSGATGKALKAQGALEVIGLELDPDAARRAAESLDQVLVGDVTQIELDFPPGHFDIILCLDVLEHLPYPEDALRRLVPLLSSEGRFVVSLPNMRYAGSLKKLIWEADWPREPSGVFDGTHLRWFTAKSARRLFQEVGLRVVQVRRNPLHVVGKLLRVLPFLRPFVSDWVTVQFLFAIEKRQPAP